MISSTASRPDVSGVHHAVHPQSLWLSDRGIDYRNRCWRDQFSITTNLPTAAGTLYYQVGEASYAFDSPDGQEAPFLVWPNLESGAPLQQIAVSITTTSLSAFCRDNTDRR